MTEDECVRAGDVNHLQTSHNTHYIERSSFVDEQTNRLREALEEHCRLVTTPVAVKLAKEGDAPPQKAKYPLEHVRNRVAVCQGMTIARTDPIILEYSY